jgi:nicotinate-nucleotide adenylyltransferase
MKIGIFGGTFDPPHVGHQILAADAQEQLRLDHILWILTPFPPHKMQQKISPIHDRLTMVLLAIAGNPKFSYSRIDVDRPPPHYAVDTMRLLHQSYPRDELIYLMGLDSLNELLTWQEPVKFVYSCDGLAIMKRAGESIDTTSVESGIPGLTEKLYYLETPMISISGSDIRNRAREGRQFRYLVPDSIYHYILNHKLYCS